MDSIEYELLRSFPIDKRYLSEKELSDLNGNPEYTVLTALYDPLFYKRLVEGQIPDPGLRITDRGLKTLSDYELEQRLIERERKRDNSTWKWISTHPTIGFWALITSVVSIVLSLCSTNNYRENDRPKKQDEILQLESKPIVSKSDSLIQKIQPNDSSVKKDSAKHN
jgi:hypothetical protein